MCQWVKEAGNLWKQNATNMHILNIGRSFVSTWVVFTHRKYLWELVRTFFLFNPKTIFSHIHYWCVYSCITHLQLSQWHQLFWSLQLFPEVQDRENVTVISNLKCDYPPGSHSPLRFVLWPLLLKPQSSRQPVRRHTLTLCPQLMSKPVTQSASFNNIQSTVALNQSPAFHWTPVWPQFKTLLWFHLRWLLSALHLKF